MSLNSQAAQETSLGALTAASGLSVMHIKALHRPQRAGGGGGGGGGGVACSWGVSGPRPDGIVVDLVAT